MSTGDKKEGFSMSGHDVAAARFADAGFFTSVMGVIIGHIADITTALQWAALIVAIVSGIIAARYHWKLTRKLDKE
jgi:hypothetical protein